MWQNMIPGKYKTDFIPFPRVFFIFPEVKEYYFDLL